MLILFLVNIYFMLETLDLKYGRTFFFSICCVAMSARFGAPTFVWIGTGDYKYFSQDKCEIGGNMYSVHYAPLIAERSTVCFSSGHTVPMKEV